MGIKSLYVPHQMLRPTQSTNKVWHSRWIKFVSIKLIIIILSYHHRVQIIKYLSNEFLSLVVRFWWLHSAANFRINHIIPSLQGLSSSYDYITKYMEQINTAFWIRLEADWDISVEIIFKLHMHMFLQWISCLGLEGSWCQF